MFVAQWSPVELTQYLPLSILLPCTVLFACQDLLAFRIQVSWSVSCFLRFSCHGHGAGLSVCLNWKSSAGLHAVSVAVGLYRIVFGNGERWGHFSYVQSKHGLSAVNFVSIAHNLFVYLLTFINFAVLISKSNLKCFVYGYILLSMFLIPFCSRLKCLRQICCAHISRGLLCTLDWLFHLSLFVWLRVQR